MAFSMDGLSSSDSAVTQYKSHLDEKQKIFFEFARGVYNIYKS